jgi:hypothetical protein
MATHHPLGTGTGAAQLPRFPVDFNDVWEHRDDGTEVLVLGTADALHGHDHPLHEGMLVVCEEPGELHMTGVVRRRLRRLHAPVLCCCCFVLSGNTQCC